MLSSFFKTRKSKNNTWGSQSSWKQNVRKEPRNNCKMSLCMHIFFFFSMLFERQRQRAAGTETLCFSAQHAHKCHGCISWELGSQNSIWLAEIYTQQSPPAAPQGLPSERVNKCQVSTPDRKVRETGPPVSTLTPKPTVTQHTEHTATTSHCTGRLFSPRDVVSTGHVLSSTVLVALRTL